MVPNGNVLWFVKKQFMFLFLFFSLICLRLPVGKGPEIQVPWAHREVWPCSQLMSDELPTHQMILMNDWLSKWVW